jgi:hypothetical protein
MPIPAEPLCPRHDAGVPMRLRSLHTESTRPGQLLGLFVCPDCGAEARHPVEAAEDVA